MYNLPFNFSMYVQNQYSSVVALQPLSITKHPINRNVLVGSSHTLTCSATGSGTLSYFWERISNGSSWTTVTDVSTTTYTTNASLPIGWYMYRCNVSNGVESVVSNSATVIVSGECYST